MEALILPLILLSIIAVVAVVAATFAYEIAVAVISAFLDAPFVPTPAGYAELVSAVLELAPGDVVYELGSGNGKFMLACALLHPETSFVGIEGNPLLYLAATLKKRRVGNPSNVSFRRADFFTVDLSPANKIYAYLLDPTMFKLGPKFAKEFKGRLASRAFPIPRRALTNVVELTDKIGAHGQHLLFVYDF